MGKAKLTKNELEKLIELFVPEELGPDKKLENNKPLLGIYLSEQEVLDRSAKLNQIECPEGKRIWATIVDMGALVNASPLKGGKLSDTLLGRYIIRVSEEADYYTAGLSLAHEIGHLVDALEKGQFERDSEAKAETYAIDKVCKLDLPYSEMIKFLAAADIDNLK